MAKGSKASSGLSERIEALAAEIKEQFGRQKIERDTLDKSLRILSEHHARITGRPLLKEDRQEAVATPVLRRGKTKGTRGPRGEKKAIRLRLGEQIHSILAKDKGTKYSTDALRSKLGDAEADIGPAKIEWNKEHPDQKIEATGPSRAKQYSVKG